MNKSNAAKESKRKRAEKRIRVIMKWQHSNKLYTLYIHSFIHSFGVVFMIFIRNLLLNFPLKTDDEIKT